MDSELKLYQHRHHGQKLKIYGLGAACVLRWHAIAGPAWHGWRGGFRTVCGSDAAGLRVCRLHGTNTHVHPGLQLEKVVVLSTGCCSLGQSGLLDCLKDICRRIFYSFALRRSFHRGACKNAQQH